MALIGIFLTIHDAESMFCCQSILWHAVCLTGQASRSSQGSPATLGSPPATVRPMQGQEAGSGRRQEPHFVLNEWVPVVSQSLAGWVGTWARR